MIVINGRNMISLVMLVWAWDSKAAGLAVVCICPWMIFSANLGIFLVVMIFSAVFLEVADGEAVDSVERIYVYGYN